MVETRAAMATTFCASLENETPKLRAPLAGKVAAIADTKTGSARCTVISIDRAATR